MKTIKYVLILVFLCAGLVLNAENIDEILKQIKPQLTAQNKAFFAELERQNISFISSKSTIRDNRFTQLSDVKIDVKNKIIYEIITVKESPKYSRKTLYCMDGIVCRDSKYCDGALYQTRPGQGNCFPKYLFSEIAFFGADSFIRTFRFVQYGVPKNDPLSMAIFDEKKTAFMDKLKNAKGRSEIALNHDSVFLRVTTKDALIESVKLQANSIYFEVKNEFFCDDKNLLQEKKALSDRFDTPAFFGFRVVKEGEVYRIKLVDASAKYLYGNLKDTISLPIERLNKKDVKQLSSSDISEIFEKSDFLEVEFIDGIHTTFKKLSERETFAIYVAEMQKSGVGKFLKETQR